MMINSIGFKFGSIAEYNSDGQYNFSAYVEEILVFLEKLECVLDLTDKKSSEIRMKFNSVKSKPYEGLNVRECESLVFAALSSYAPEGYWFGRARSNSNIVGFWPNEWLVDKRIVPVNSVIRNLGKCSYSPATL